jgi:glutamate-1-semialdehyde 2,1-aminomutase
MTGFRLAPGGAQQLYNIKADMTTLGKIIGGGLPVGAYGGRRDIMDTVSPAGPVYQAGTLSGNPMAMAAGLAMLRFLRDHLKTYDYLNEISSYIVAGIQKNLKAKGLPFTINQVGSMFTLFFTAEKVVDFTTAKTSDTELFGKYFQAMLKRGIYLAPSQYEALFISAAIDQQIADKIIKASNESFEEILQ